MANDYRLETTLHLYSKVEALVAGTATLAKRLDFGVLVLSVLTSGSLWLLISDVLPKSTLWFGAIASSLTTGITLYMSTTGINRTRSRALALHGRVAKLLARVRAGSIEDGDFWDEYKNLEHEFTECQYARSD